MSDVLNRGNDVDMHIINRLINEVTCRINGGINASQLYSALVINRTRRKDYTYIQLANASDNDDCFIMTMLSVGIPDDLSKSINIISDLFITSVENLKHDVYDFMPFRTQLKPILVYDIGHDQLDGILHDVISNKPSVKTYIDLFEILESHVREKVKTDDILRCDVAEDSDTYESIIKLIKFSFNRISTNLKCGHSITTCNMSMKSFKALVFDTSTHSCSSPQVLRYNETSCNIVQDITTSYMSEKQLCVDNVLKNISSEELKNNICSSLYEPQDKPCFALCEHMN